MCRITIKKKTTIFLVITFSIIVIFSKIVMDKNSNRRDMSSGKTDNNEERIDNNGDRVVDDLDEEDVDSDESEGGPKNLVLGLDYEISEPASEEYPDLGNQLTDGRYGTLNYQNQAWQGHANGTTRSIIFDLGNEKSISQIKANFLEQDSVGIHIPNAVSFYASNDKHLWSKIIDIDVEDPWESRSSSKVWEYVWDNKVDGIPDHPDSEYIYARYIQVRFRPNVWAFIDEVEVLGYNEKLDRAVALTSDDFTEPVYLAPGDDSTDINNLVLLYNGWYANGAGDWTKDNIIPYISYVDTDGKPIDWMFDGVLYLGLKTPQGRDFHSSESSTIVQDWKWYLDKTFGKDGEMDQLNLAVEEVSAQLDDPEYRLKTVLMIPYPSYTVDDFGEIYEGKPSYNFNHEKVGWDQAFKNRKGAVKWYIDEVLKSWDEGNYAHLELDGLYWVSESIGYNVPYEEELIQYTSDLIHENEMKFYWIPYFTANKINLWKELGFDVAYLQPNHFFNETDESRIQEATLLAKDYGMGMEIEFDERMNLDIDFKEKYADYLNGGIKYGYLESCVKAYYQGNTSLLDASRSDDPQIRQNYEMMYEFLKGSYEIHE